MQQQIPTKNKPATLSGAAILNAYTAIAVTYCGSFTFLYYFLASNVFLSVLHSLALLGVVTNYVLLKRSKNYDRTEFIMTIGTVVVIGMFASGGWDDTGFLWPFAFLPFVFFMTEPGKSIYWISALIIGCGIATGLQFAGIIRQPWSGIAVMNFFACLTVFMACNFFIKRKALNYKEVLDYTHRLLESSIDPFFTIDEQGRIKDVNLACEKITGISTDALKGSEFSVHFNSPVLAEIFCRLALTEGKVVNYRLLITPENEEPVELLFNAALYRDEKGRFQNIFAVGRDITEGRKLEKRLREFNEELELQVKAQTRQLAQKAAELEQFAYFASHDLQEPLNTTAGFIRLLQQKYKDQADAESEKYFNYVLQSSERMKTLIRELLEYSRLGSNEEWQEVDCQVIVQEVLADLADAIRRQQATVNVGPLPVIKAHPIECKLLFQNLLSNAIKFKKPDTPVVVHFSAERSGDTWTFVMKDNGMGIEEIHLERIFNLFKRLHNRDQYEGTGIGLAHCRKIVELHGGKIWVKSKFGVGSQFYLTFPING
jgi:PAS domain S-box-containing protein